MHVRRARRARLVSAVFLVGLARAASAQCPPAVPPALLNEVLYDATGDDTGREFVELYNPGPTTVSLQGLRLEAGDGSGPGRWTLRWSGVAAESIAPDRRFVIGGALVAPAPDRIVDLNLQNGPDGVRLVWPDGTSEVLGWGTLEFPEYFCGAPAVDVVSGMALARRPDGVRRGTNAADFSAAPPSPGDANQRDREVAWVPGAQSLSPESPEPGVPCRLAGRVANIGTRLVYEGEVGLAVLARNAQGDTVALYRGVVGRALSSGDTVAVDLPLRFSTPGKYLLRLELALADEPTSRAGADSLRVRVGGGPLVLSEINFQPRSGEPEWVEVRARESVSVDGFGLADAHDLPGHVHAPGAVLPPDSLGLLTQDRAALLLRRPQLDGGRVWEVAPWAALNNTDDPSGVADRVTLREPDGTWSDGVSYSASGVPDGTTLERGADGAWHPLAEGSPLEPPHALAAIRGRWQVSPARWRPSSGMPLTLRYALPWPEARASVDLYDMSGRLRTAVVHEREIGARGEWRMESAGLRGLPAGYYLVVLRARPKGGGESVVERQLLRVEGEGP